MRGKRLSRRCRSILERLETRALLSTIYVDADAPAGTENGASWGTAYTDLTTAITAAVAGDEIHVADGTYKPTTTTTRTISFQLKNGVQIKGGYAGHGAVDPDERDTAGFVTVLSGDIGVLGDTSDNSHHVVAATSIDNTALLDGFTIRDGNYTLTPNTIGGGGLYNSNSSPFILDCLFTNNRTKSFGGAVSNSTGSSPTFDNCRFIENVGTYTPGLPGFAGAMYNAPGSSPTVINSLFRRNVGAVGGAVHNNGAKSTFINCRFEGNATHNGGHRGGAMFIQGVEAPSVIQCTFVGNRSNLLAGAVEVQDCAAKFTNCTFAGNSAPTNIIQLFDASPVVTNCVIWGNTTTGSLITSTRSTITINYSNVQGGWAGTGNTNADPLFAQNPEDGVDNVWGTTDDEYGNLRPQVSSPCLDVGNNSAVPFGTLTDLDGNPRFSDVIGVNDPGSIVDMGVFEQLGASTFTAVHSAFLYDTPQQAIRFGFNEAVDPTTIASGDLTLLNLTTNTPVDTSTMATTTYDGLTFSIKWNFASILADGNYRATLSVGVVSDLAANGLVAPATFDFFILGGDANRDRMVDARDLVILSSNWYGSGKVFSQGDFNYDTLVNAADLSILATHWNQRLDAPPPPPAAPTPTVARRAPVRTPVRTLALVEV